MTTTDTHADLAVNSVDDPPGRFFGFFARLGIVRDDGWLGGVCGGLAQRIGVDALLVRGAALVAALFGLPALLFYGLAWMLVPDPNGRILLRDLLHARLRPGVIGALITVLVGLFPWPLLVFLALTARGEGWATVEEVDGTQTYRYVRDFASNDTGLVTVGVIALVGAALAVLFLFLIVRAVRRTSDAPSGLARMAFAPGASSSPVAHADSGSAGAAGDTPDAAGLTASASSDEDSAARSDADASDEMELWREQQAAWKEQNTQWRVEQQDAARSAKKWDRARRKEAAATFAADVAERRRIRRLTKPRAPFGLVAVAIGLAAIVGTAVALASSGPLTLALGFFVGALVFAAGMIVAGALRRRSGVLAFLTLATLLAGVGFATPPALSALHVGRYGLSTLAADSGTGSETFFQLWGVLDIYVADRGVDVPALQIEKRGGESWIEVEHGTTLAFDLTIDAARVDTWVVIDQEWRSLFDLPGLRITQTGDWQMRIRGTIRAEGEWGDPESIVADAATKTLILEQESGQILIRTLGPDGDE